MTTKNFKLADSTMMIESIAIRLWESGLVEITVAQIKKYLPEIMQFIPSDRIASRLLSAKTFLVYTGKTNGKKTYGCLKNPDGTVKINVHGYP